MRVERGQMKGEKRTEQRKEERKEELPVVPQEPVLRRPVLCPLFPGRAVL